jgi:hypothetical protein
MNGITWGSVAGKGAHEKVIIVASGRSLEGFDFERLRGLGTIIAVNGAGSSVPFADMWFTLDPWGLHGPQLPVNFRGQKYAAVSEDFGRDYAVVAEHRKVPAPNITFLHRLRQHNLAGVSSETAFKKGLSEDNSCINTGNSGYGALNLAYHLRPKKILLLGIDGGMGYFYTKDSSNRPLTYLPEMFDSSLPQLQEAGIEVINGSINSAIKTFPRFTVSDALKEFAK